MFVSDFRSALFAISDLTFVDIRKKYFDFAKPIPTFSAVNITLLSL